MRFDRGRRGLTREGMRDVIGRAGMGCCRMKGTPRWGSSERELDRPQRPIRADIPEGVLISGGGKDDALIDEGMDDIEQLQHKHDPIEHRGTAVNKALESHDPLPKHRVSTLLTKHSKGGYIYISIFTSL